MQPGTDEEILETNRSGELLYKGPLFTVRKLVSVITVCKENWITNGHIARCGDDNEVKR